MIDRVFVKSVEGHVYLCQIAMFEGRRVVVCGRCKAILAFTGISQLGATCARCGAVVELIHRFIPPIPGVVTGDNVERPVDWQYGLTEAIRDVHAMAHPGLPPSDHGLDGARPLPPIEWMPGAPIGDREWSIQNRRINDLLADRRHA